MEKGTELVENKTENGVDTLRKSYYFGCGPCHPKCLQYVFARKAFFTFLLSAFSFLQSGIVSGCISTALSTLQKRYNFTSLSAGIISLVYDLTVFVCIIFMTYFGSKTHPPRLLGCSVLLMSFGVILFAMPQFIFGRYEVGTEDSVYLKEACQDSLHVNNVLQNCDSANTGAYVIFILSSIIIGAAASPIYSLGPAYIDEIVYPKYVALHIGAFGMSFIVGGIMGYGVGSAFLSTYVDPWYATTLTPEDPAWVGAWWMSFLLLGVFLILLSIPFLMFPRYLPDSHLVQEERVKEMAKVYSSKYANEDSLSITVKMFPIHIKRLFLNPSFIFMTVGYSIISLFIQGIITFSPKYYEVQFDLTSSTAGIVVGALAIPGGLVGTLSGAFIVFVCKLKGHIDALIVTIVTIVIIPFVLFFLLHCPQVKVIEIPDSASTVYPLHDACSSMCNCTSNILEPVCGSDGLNYFSGCRAGCDKLILSDGHLSFENCTCIGESLYNSTLLVNATATDGYCQNSLCLQSFIPALLGSAALTFLAFVAQIPFIHFMLRVVADDQRALALAVQSAMSRLIGDVPGPLIFGALFDATCISWNYECGERGNCWLYDKDKLSYAVVGTGVACSVIAVFCYFLSWMTYPKRTNNDNKEEPINIETK